MTETQVFDYDDEGTDPFAFWSTTNLAEAIPGVPTPLSWTVWRPALEMSLRRSFATIGALEHARVADPTDQRERIIGIFAGRAAGRVNFLGEMGDRLPGTSGAAVAEQFLGRLPADFRSESTRRRLPVIAFRFPWAFAASARRVHAALAEATRQWSETRAVVSSLSLQEVRRRWREATVVFAHMLTAHGVVNFSRVQPAYDQVLRLAKTAQRPELAGKVLAGQGSHAELDMVEDLWAVSRGTQTTTEFLSRHGYHGPAEGELSSWVWREDAGPAHVLVEQYGFRSADDSPAEHSRRLAALASEAERSLIAAQPFWRRPLARLILAAAHRLVPLRGVGKAAFLLAFDVCRMLARRAGQLLALDGVIDEPDDIFYLTTEELLGVGERDRMQETVRTRRLERRRLEQLVIPGSWRGRPTVTAAQEPDRHGPVLLQGVGASPGIVEGPVRVVLEADFANFEPGEILVAPVTDPAWAPIMFLSSALVVDIGGLLSHAAVVARELGIPCVMGVGTATTRLRSGDRCRVDGTDGTVEVIERMST